MLTESEVLKLLRAEADRLGSQKALADKIGIGTAYLSDVLAGKRGIGDPIQKYLGLERRVLYARVRR